MLLFTDLTIGECAAIVVVVCRYFSFFPSRSCKCSPHNRPKKILQLEKNLRQTKVYFLQFETCHAKFSANKILISRRVAVFGFPISRWRKNCYTKHKFSFYNFVAFSSPLLFLFFRIALLGVCLFLKFFSLFFFAKNQRNVQLSDPNELKTQTRMNVAVRLLVCCVRSDAETRSVSLIRSGELQVAPRAAAWRRLRDRVGAFGAVVIAS